MEKRTGVHSVHFDASTLMFGMLYDPAVFSPAIAEETIETVGKEKYMPYKMVILD